MRLWLVHSSEISLQDQIVTQLSLAILTRQLGPGARLPSVRVLARRFALHPNTVSLAYRRLVREGWAELRAGRGVYVSLSSPDAGSRKAPQPEAVLAQLIADLVDVAGDLRVAPETLHRLLDKALTPRPSPPRPILLEPDPGLAQIVIAEIAAALGITPERRDFAPPPGELEDALVLVLPSKEALARAHLPTSARLQVLPLRSVSDALAPWLPAPSSTLIGVFSHWPRFLELGRTMLIAAGFPSESLVVRDARDAQAPEALRLAEAVICDTVSAALLPPGVHTIVFRLLADDGLDQLRRACDASETPTTATPSHPA